jgi:hypothetical protein
MSSKLGLRSVVTSMRPSTVGVNRPSILFTYSRAWSTVMICA